MDIDQTVRAAWNETAPHNQWIVEIADDYVIVTDEKDRSFARVPVLVGDTVQFGQPVKVTPGFVEVAASAPVHRVVFASRAESRPEVAAAEATVLDSPPPPVEIPDYRPPAEPAPPADPSVEPAPGSEEPQTPPPPGGVPASGDSPGPDSGAEPVTNELEGDRPVSTLSADVRSRLGLTDDADDAAVVAALDALKTKAEQPTEPNPEQVAASASARDEMKAEITRLSTELASIKASSAADAKKAFFDAVVNEGRIAPADREGWEARFDRAPDVIREVLASIAPNTAVPVQAAGYTGTGDEGAVDKIDAEYERMFTTSGKAAA